MLARHDFKICSTRVLLVDPSRSACFRLFCKAEIQSRCKDFEVYSIDLRGARARVSHTAIASQTSWPAVASSNCFVHTCDPASGDFDWRYPIAGSDVNEGFGGIAATSDGLQKLGTNGGRGPEPIVWVDFNAAGGATAVKARRTIRWRRDSRGLPGAVRSRSRGTPAIAIRPRR